MKYTDPDGCFANIVGEIIAGAAIGAIAGIASQVVQDVMKGEISDFASYAGSALGGAAGGVVLAVTKNTVLANAVAGAVGGLVGNTTKQTIRMATDKQDTFDIQDCVENTIIGGVVGGALSDAKINRITSGRNSWDAIGKSIHTRGSKGALETGLKYGFSRCISGTLIEGSFVAPLVKNELSTHKEYLKQNIENIQDFNTQQEINKKAEYYKQLYGN